LTYSLSKTSSFGNPGSERGELAGPHENEADLCLSGGVSRVWFTS
jgi:hypothetical protein